MTDEKLNRIEETLAHQEQQIHDLSEITIRQGHEIELLKKHILKLDDKISIIEEDGYASDDKALSATEQARRDKPPHY